MFTYKKKFFEKEADLVKTAEELEMTRALLDTEQKDLRYTYNELLNQTKEAYKCRCALEECRLITENYQNEVRKMAAFMLENGASAEDVYSQVAGSLDRGSNYDDYDDIEGCIGNSALQDLWYWHNYYDRSVDYTVANTKKTRMQENNYAEALIKLGVAVPANRRETVKSSKPCDTCNNRGWETMGRVAACNCCEAPDYEFYVRVKASIELPPDNVEY